MKTLILALSFVVAASANAEYISGDRIHFQKDSTWVSSYYNKTACLRGATYEAVVSKCIETRNSGDNDHCVRYAKTKIFQPMNSTRLRCDRFTGRDDNNCAKWVRVPYVQKQVRTVSVHNDRNDSVIRTFKFTIPACK